MPGLFVRRSRCGNCECLKTKLKDDPSATGRWGDRSSGKGRREITLEGPYLVHLDSRRGRGRSGTKGGVRGRNRKEVREERGRGEKKEKRKKGEREGGERNKKREGQEEKDREKREREGEEERGKRKRE